MNGEHLVIEVLGLPFGTLRARDITCEGSGKNLPIADIPHVLLVNIVELSSRRPQSAPRSQRPIAPEGSVSKKKEPSFFGGSRDESRKPYRTFDGDLPRPRIGRARRPQAVYRPVCAAVP
jgi:hypothetical protein